MTSCLRASAGVAARTAPGPRHGAVPRARVHMAHMTSLDSSANRSPTRARTHANSEPSGKSPGPQSHARVHMVMKIQNNIQELRGPTRARTHGLKSRGPHPIVRSGAGVIFVRPSCLRASAGGDGPHVAASREGRERGCVVRRKETHDNGARKQRDPAVDPPELPVTIRMPPPLDGLAAGSPADCSRVRAEDGLPCVR